MEEIFEIMRFYSKKNQCLNDELMYYLFKYFIEEKNLEDYVHHIIFRTINQSKTNHKSNNTMMAYNSYNNTIEVDNNKLMECVRKINNSTIREKLDDEEFNLFIITVFLDGILHELEHANQLKISNENKFNFENHLFKLCLNSTNEVRKFNKDKVYKAFHLLEYIDIKNNLIDFNRILCDYDNRSPMERFANIHASNEIIKMLKTEDEHTKKLQKIWTKKNIGYALNGFDFKEKIPAPTLRYLNDLVCLGLIEEKDYRHFKKLADNRDLSLESRLKLGLDITEDEHQKILTLTK